MGFKTTKPCTKNGCSGVMTAREIDTLLSAYYLCAKCKKKEVLTDSERAMLVDAINQVVNQKAKEPIKPMIPNRAPAPKEPAKSATDVAQPKEEKKTDGGVK